MMITAEATARYCQRGLFVLLAAGYPPVMGVFSVASSLGIIPASPARSAGARKGLETSGVAAPMAGVVGVLVP